MKITGIKCDEMKISNWPQVKHTCFTERKMWNSENSIIMPVSEIYKKIKNLLISCFHGG